MFCGTVRRKMQFFRYFIQFRVRDIILSYSYAAYQSGNLCLQLIRIVLRITVKSDRSNFAERSERLERIDIKVSFYSIV